MARQKKDMTPHTARIQFEDGFLTERSEWAKSYADMEHILRSIYCCKFKILWISGPQGTRYYK